MRVACRCPHTSSPLAIHDTHRLLHPLRCNLLTSAARFLSTLSADASTPASPPPSSPSAASSSSSRPRLIVTEVRRPAFSSPTPPRPTVPPPSPPPPPPASVKPPPTPSSRSPRAPTSNAAAAAAKRVGSAWLQWLSRKLGYEQLQPVLRLYHATSTRAGAPELLGPRSLGVASSIDGRCALLTLHMWVLHSRTRELLFEDVALHGRRAQSEKSPLQRSLHLLFELFWQEMDTLVREEEEGEAFRVFTAAEYTQLAYGAMVSYDRAWHRYRQTGNRHQMYGALWRNALVGRDTIREGELHRLFRYTEQLKQISNRWTAEQLIVRGEPHWGPLPVEVAVEDAAREAMLTYSPELYDGSRIKEGESVSVPFQAMWKWWNKDESFIAVDLSPSADETDQRVLAGKRPPAALPSSHKG